jgi:hypothetical protein
MTLNLTANYLITEPVIAINTQQYFIHDFFISRILYYANDPTPEGEVTL